LSEPAASFPDALILDACCLINLAASRQMEPILRCLPTNLYVAEYVFSDEALWFYDGPEEAFRSRQSPIQLKPLADAGLLNILTLDTEDEELAFVNFAASLDDGEAMTLALALHRGHGVATDERKAIRVIERTMPTVQVLTTPDLLSNWAHQTKPSASLLRTSLHNIEIRAKFEPSRDHALSTWWQQALTANEQPPDEPV
jgi:hypothetical protein